MRVLILGGRAPVALDHARRFAAQGWTVYIADSVPCRISGWSRVVAATLRVPPPRHALPQFAAELGRLIESLHIDLVLPTCEEVFYLSRIRHLLPATCQVFVAPFEQLRELHSKWTFLSLARASPVHVPASARVVSLAAAREWAQGRAVVLKPEFSRFGVHVRINPEGIPANAAPLPELGAWIVQEFRAGLELCSYSVAVDGRLRAHVTYQPRYRLASSSSYYFDGVCVPGIQQFVADFVARLRFTGQISFDWIQGADSSLAVLECNPRAISGLHLFALADDLPAAMCGADLPCITPQPTARMLAAVMLAVGLPAAVRRSQFQRWRADWARASDVLAVTGDARPYAGAVLDMGSFARLALRNRSSLRAASTRDIEWDGDALHI